MISDFFDMLGKEKTNLKMLNGNVVEWCTKIKSFEAHCGDIEIWSNLGAIILLLTAWLPVSTVSIY